MEIPYNWIILELPDKQYKVFASYINESWKVNSGIKSVVIDDDYYLFYGYSGSIYKCHKYQYGVANAYCSNVLSTILSKADGKIKLIEDKNNIKNILIYLQER